MINRAGAELRKAPQAEGSVFSVIVAGSSIDVAEVESVGHKIIEAIVEIGPAVLPKTIHPKNDAILQFMRSKN